MRALWKLSLGVVLLVIWTTNASAAVEDVSARFRFKDEFKKVWKTRGEFKAKP